MKTQKEKDSDITKELCDEIDSQIQSRQRRMNERKEFFDSEDKKDQDFIDRLIIQKKGLELL